MEVFEKVQPCGCWSNWFRLRIIVILKQRRVIFVQKWSVRGLFSLQSANLCRGFAFRELGRGAAAAASVAARDGTSGGGSG